MRRFGWLSTVALVSGILSLATGCAGSKTASDTSEIVDGTGGSAPGAAGACTPGKQDECACPGGAKGVQACLADGSGYAACDCAVGGGSGGSAPKVGCGDGVCTPAHEDCHSCAADCGACVPCLEAPSCNGAAVPPVAMDHLASLDIPAMTAMPKEAILARLGDRIAAGGPGARILAAALAAPRDGEHAMVAALRGVFASNPKVEATLRAQLAAAGMSDAERYHLTFPVLQPTMSVKDGEFPGGTMACGAPLLRVRVAQVDVIEDEDDIANDIVYCSVSAEAQAGSEIRVTPKTPALDQGQSFQYSIDAGIIWGQNKPRTPGSNLLITYDCFESDESGGWQKLVDQIAQASSKVGGILNEAGQSGWVFQVAGAVLPLIADAMALDSDDHLFNATQTLGMDQQLDMTNGRYWTVRRSGTHLWSDWDWQLRIEAWGCAEYGQK